MAALLERAGLVDPWSSTPISGGGNNRVFRIDATGSSVLLKQYFRHPDDPRDRLAAEWAFATYAWNKGVPRVPRPLACDAEAGLALFEFLPGRVLRPGEVTHAHVLQAAGFVEHLNADRLPAGAADLGPASEACFSLGEHVERVDVRVARLQTIEVTNEIEAAAARFVSEELSRRWNILRAPVLEAAQRNTGGLLAESSRIVSPSDFGFHNAMCDDEGRLRFFDFEYAGWDDPAKLVCDFFCQVKVPAPRASLPAFAQAIGGLVDDSAALQERVHRLLPVYAVKWCCIVLNEFVPTSAARREFSSGESRESRQQVQLAKAGEMLARLEGERGGDAW